LNAEYLEKARENVANTEVLVNLVSRRIRQLYRGGRPMVKPDFPNQETEDIVLKEIAEGKLTAEMIMLDETAKHSDDVLSVDEFAISL
jgi:DNA-directed RNA polymerase subunit omega